MSMCINSDLQEPPPITCADQESFVRGGPTLTFFLIVDQWREYKQVITGPSPKLKHDNDGPTLNAGLVAL